MIAMLYGGGQERGYRPGYVSHRVPYEYKHDYHEDIFFLFESVVSRFASFRLHLARFVGLTK